jgi:gliding motility-associated-like protein
MKFAPAVLIVILTFNAASAQYEWLATFNYPGGALNRLGNIPGVTRVDADNSAFDQNNQRFFFQGNATGILPFTLYTVNAVTGSVIYSVVCPSNMPVGTVAGLQYDNGVDTLYGLYLGGVSFCWIDPSNGAVHEKATIPGYQGYNWSAYDTRDHWYMVSDGNSMLVIDARTGAILYNPTLATNISDLVFDNLTGKLYGISQSSTSASQFDSITISTGAVHPIAPLPALTLPGVNAYTIDEKAGKYIFLGADPPGPACISNYLYVLDINTGAIISRTLYPYGQGFNTTTDENLLGYSFDNQRGILYALNWHPPPGSVTKPQVSIAVDPVPPCAGMPVSFTATPGTGVINPSYQWQLNGSDVGTNGTVYTNNNLAAGDSVRCILTNNPACITGAKDTSKAMGIPPSPPNPAVTITTANNILCSGDTTFFTATPVNGGASPAFQWQINGGNTGSGTDTLVCTFLQNGDTVYCIMTGNLPCSLPATSNKILVTVNPTPTLNVGNDTVISPGQHILMNPSISGIIASYEWIPATYLDNPAIARPTATPVTSTTYRLTITTAEGCQASGKITIVIYHPLKMPNAFTPNGDGRDDIFRIPPVTIQKIQSFSVFNRWGQLIFHTMDNSAGWDGNYNGQPQPMGTYVWLIYYQDGLTKKFETARGTVELIR